MFDLDNFKKDIAVVMQKHGVGVMSVYVEPSCEDGCCGGRELIELEDLTGKTICFVYEFYDG